ncbi:MAG TPA: hypothetical protein VFZ25_15265 [Chloroflexota bacterium]|nr:hypothetical protein [Chloroflexota bacterium]
MADGVHNVLVNLFSAYGYNLYEGKNRARADDLVLREKVADELANAAAALRSLRTAYQKRFIPPPSRENPSPPPERLAALRAIGESQQRVSDLESRVRGMTVPTQDRVWEKFRGEKALLNQLILHDYNLAAPAVAIRERCQALRPAEWGDDVESSLADLIDQVEAAARQRAGLLQGGM